MDSQATLIFPLALLLALPGACTPTHAAKPFRGPVEAKVVEILDGDTFVAEATVWPGHTVRVNVRIRGIDAPEMKARCPAERRAAEKARQTLAALLRAGVAVVSNIAGAKYYGRVLADVATPDGRLWPRSCSITDWCAPTKAAAARPGAVEPAAGRCC